MNISDKFEKYFSVENLKEIFKEHIVYSRATGIDNLDQYAFRVQLDDQVEILSRKVLSGSYNFTKYKLKLVSKGRGKAPREISIPTVRDRIALRSLCNFLSDIYQGSIEFDLPQNIVKKVKVDLNSSSYDACIKLDVAGFYPSIKHAELISRLGKKIRNPSIKNVIAQQFHRQQLVFQSRQTFGRRGASPKAWPFLIFWLQSTYPILINISVLLKVLNITVM